MEHSYKFFENKACKYNPCHEGMEQINCLFCYCPLYDMENYDTIIKLLSR